MHRHQKHISIVLLFSSVAATVAIGQPDLPWSTGAKSPRIEALQKHVESGNSAAVRRFWAEVATEHTPLLEPMAGDPAQSLVTFVFRGGPDTYAIVLYTHMIMGGSLHQQIDQKGAPERVYTAFVKAKQFVSFTGQLARIDRSLAALSPLFGGLIEGHIIELSRIRRGRPSSWARGEFSIVRFDLKANGLTTTVILDHKGFQI